MVLKKKQWVTIDVTNDVIANLGKQWAVAILNPPSKYDSLHFYAKENKKNIPELIIHLSPNTIPSPTPVISQVPTAAISPSPTVIVGTKTPTKMPTTPVASPTSVPGGASYPSQILNLINWKITLPIGPEEDPLEIEQPELATYRIDPWFLVNAEKNAVRFRAPVNGVTTDGSGYPRSELREMTNNGEAKAAWSSTVGTHTMTVEEAFTAVPKIKKHVVGSQIHDGGDDVIVIRLEYPKLFIDIAGEDGPTLDPNYTLGKKFKVRYEVSGGKTRIYYSNSTTPEYLAYTLEGKEGIYSAAYFKVGAYTQSKCKSTGGLETDCSANNYGEVVVYKVDVTHR